MNRVVRFFLLYAILSLVTDSASAVTIRQPDHDWMLYKREREWSGGYDEGFGLQSWAGSGATDIVVGSHRLRVPISAPVVAGLLVALSVALVLASVITTRARNVEQSKCTERRDGPSISF